MYGICALLDHLLQLTFVLLAKFIVWLRPYLSTLCFIATWAMVAMLVVSLFTMITDGLANIRQMHRVPCANCRYSTSDYRLKCSVHPSAAFSEEAIGCADFEGEPARL